MATAIIISGIGRIAREPESRTVGQYNSKLVSSAIGANFRVKGADGQWKDAPRFWNVVCWGNKSDNLAALHKGDLVYFNGELLVEEYTDKKTGQVKQIEKLDLSKVFPIEKRASKTASAPSEPKEKEKFDGFPKSEQSATGEEEPLPF